jgi:AraC family transcriptional regulator
MAVAVQHDGAGLRGATGSRARLGARARSEHDRCEAVDRVIAAMHERIDRPFALDEMARIAYLSPFYFNRTFRKLTGLPPRRFHTALRIAAAKRLLLTTDFSVTEVCLEVGYQSLGTFTTHFHELVGVSPRELRRLAAKPAPSAAEVAYAFATSQDGSAAPAVEGNVHGVAQDRLVFIGLFQRPYPEGVPIACTALAGPGRYALWTSAEGSYHVAAAAFMSSEDVRRCLLPDAGSALVASTSAPVRLSRHESATRDLRLRPARGTDPPILLALPVAAAGGAPSGAGSGGEFLDAASG